MRNTLTNMRGPSLIRAGYVRFVVLGVVLFLIAACWNIANWNVGGIGGSRVQHTFDDPRIILANGTTADLHIWTDDRYIGRIGADETAMLPRHPCAEGDAHITCITFALGEDTSRMLRLDISTALSGVPLIIAWTSTAPGVAVTPPDPSAIYAMVEHTSAPAFPRDDPMTVQPIAAHEWSEIDRITSEWGLRCIVYPPNGGGFINSVGMRMLRIPDGRFRQGADPSEPGATRIETPARDVTLSGSFFLGETEVTCGQWHRVMGSSLPAAADPALPITNITWFQAVGFCRRLSELEDRTYRLPTEAEWEYACRAGTRSTFFFGENLSRVNLFAWTNANARGVLKRVRQLRCNPWGLYDIQGNAREFCADWFAYYSPGPVVDPRGPPGGVERVRRGGFVSFYPGVTRSAARGCQGPSDAYADVGFRVVCEEDQNEYRHSTNGLQLVMWDSGDRGTWNQGIAFALWSDGVCAIAESFPRASADLRWRRIDPSARERILDSWFDAGQSCFAVQTLAPSAASASVRFTSAEGAKEQDFSYFKLHYPDEYLDKCMKAIRAAIGVIEQSCAGASGLAPPEKEAEVASWNVRNRPRVSESK